MTHKFIASINKLAIDKEGASKLTLDIPLDNQDAIRDMIESNAGGSKIFAVAMIILDNNDVDELEILKGAL